MTTKLFTRLAFCFALLGFPLSGCVFAAAATAGAVAGSEIAENDGEFDPFENTEAMRALKRQFR
ncbi:MAG: hypothetical protein AAGC57_05195 [Pseudomonadota bacterium]